jgi:hypothetical protein
VRERERERERKLQTNVSKACTQNNEKIEESV